MVVLLTAYYKKMYLVKIRKEQGQNMVGVIIGLQLEQGQGWDQNRVMVEIGLSLEQGWGQNRVGVRIGLGLGFDRVRVGKLVFKLVLNQLLTA